MDVWNRKQRQQNAAKYKRIIKDISRHRIIPCYICNGQAYIDYMQPPSPGSYHPENDYWVIRCSGSCHTQLKAPCLHHTPQELVETWNTTNTVKEIS